MKQLLISILILSSFIGFTQNPKKILSENELKILDSTGIFIKTIDDGRYIGDLLFKKVNKKIKSIEIGKWISNSESEPYTIMNWDSTGRLLDYKEYNLDKSIGFDCTYNYDSINGKYYRLEDMMSADENGNVLTKGHRYWLIKKDKFGFYQLSKKKKYGNWEIYDASGNLIKTYNYGDIK